MSLFCEKKEFSYFCLQKTTTNLHICDRQIPIQNDDFKYCLQMNSWLLSNVYSQTDKVENCIPAHETTRRKDPIKVDYTKIESVDTMHS